MGSQSKRLTGEQRSPVESDVFLKLTHGDRQRSSDATTPLSSSPSSTDQRYSHTHIPIKTPFHKASQLHGTASHSSASSLSSASAFSQGSYDTSRPSTPQLARQLLYRHSDVNTASNSGTSSPISSTPGSPSFTKRSLKPTRHHQVSPTPDTGNTLTHVKETHEVSIDYDPISGRKVLNSYEIIRELGRGQHGKVKLARDIETSQYVAIKIIDRNGRLRLGRSGKSANTQEEKVRREIAILKKCHHPNIVQLIEVLDDLTSRKIYLVLEYVEKGELIWQNDDLTPALSRSMIKSTARDVLLGLEYLHFQGIIHRDIKPANLLLSKDGRVKISDFGVSYATSLNYDNDELELAKTAGTPAFFAPELCLPTSSDSSRRTYPITHKIDIWAFGVTLYCFLYGDVPFMADSEFELFNVIVNNPVTFPDEISNESIADDNDSHDVQTSGDSANLLDDIDGKKAASVQNDESTNNSSSINQSKESNSKNERKLSESRPNTPLHNRVSKITLTDRAAYVKPTGSVPHATARIDADLELAKDLIRELLEKDPNKRIDIPDIKRHPWISDGMTAPSLENFLSSETQDQRIEVTDKEMKTAVRGISGKIKRGLTKIGNSALELAGIRRKPSSDSIYTFVSSSGGAPSSADSEISPEISSSKSRPRISSASEIVKTREGMLAADSNGPRSSSFTDAIVAKGNPDDKSKWQPSSSGNLKFIPLSSSNMNLNSLLQGGASSLEEIDLADHHEAMRVASNPILGTNSTEQSLNDGEEPYDFPTLSQDSREEFDEDEDESDGELTLVLGPHRQFPSVSMKKDVDALRRTTSQTSVRDYHRTRELRESHKRQDERKLNNTIYSMKTEQLDVQRSIARVSDRGRTHANVNTANRYRSNSVTVAILERQNRDRSSTPV